MKQAKGTIVRTVNIMNHDYAIALPEGNFLVSNGDEHLREEDYGKEAIVKYDPQDQFCKFICFVSEPAETICCEHCGHEYDRHIGDQCPNCGHLQSKEAHHG